VPGRDRHAERAEPPLQAVVLSGEQHRRRDGQRDQASQNEVWVRSSTPAVYTASSQRAVGGLARSVPELVRVEAVALQPAMDLHALLAQLAPTAAMLPLWRVSIRAAAPRWAPRRAAWAWGVSTSLLPWERCWPRPRRWTAPDRPVRRACRARAAPPPAGASGRAAPRR
jgi:hypothetical protein